MLNNVPDSLQYCFSIPFRDRSNPVRHHGLRTRQREKMLWHSVYHPLIFRQHQHSQSDAQTIRDILLPTATDVVDSKRKTKTILRLKGGDGSFTTMSTGPYWATS